MAKADDQLMELQNRHDRFATKAREWADKAVVAEQRLQERGMRMEELDIGKDIPH